MAEFPCDAHLARYQGPSTRLYLQVYRDDLKAKFRLSVCPLCLGTLLEDWLAKACHETNEGYWDPPEEGQELEALFLAPESPVRRPGRLRTA